MFNKMDTVIDSIPAHECISYYNYFTKGNFTDADYRIHLKAKIRDCCSHSRIRNNGKIIICKENLFRFYNQISWCNHMIDKYKLPIELKYIQSTVN